MSIVLGYDESPGSRPALALALELATRFDEPLVLVYGVEPPGGLGEEFQAHQRALTEMGRTAVEPGWLSLLARGVVAGWIIALMVWMLPAASAEKVLVIFLMTWLIGALHLAHIIAGSAEVLYLAAVGEISYGHYLANWMLPTLLGNVVGGVALVAALNHQQVKAG